ncbi:hypothetical protein [Eubacterium sp. LMAG:50]
MSTNYNRIYVIDYSNHCIRQYMCFIYCIFVSN